jgi:isoquinoline 1-oxidoreductase
MNGKAFTDGANEVERYEFAEKPRYRFDVSRRAFVQVVGAGLLITSTGGVSFAQGRRRPGGRRTEPVAARLHIGEDGTIRVFSSKVDVGQGSRTQLTQAAAEELRVAPDRITMVLADTELCPDDGGTYGSHTTPRTVPMVRQTAAAAREILVAMACEEWGVDRESVAVADGVVTHMASSRGIAYAELAKREDLAASFQDEAPQQAEVRDHAAWQTLGKPMRKVNGRAVVTGALRYPSDIRRPNMVYGKILRPTSFGAELTDIDMTAAEDMNGVRAVRDGQFVGCTAATSFQAGKAIEALAATAQWETEPHPSSSELFDYLKEHATREGEGRRGPERDETGSVKEAMASAGAVVRAQYNIPYIQHAPMEPRAAMAEWEDGKLTVWTGTQAPSRVHSQLTEAFALREDRVRVIVPTTGGGFGGKHSGETAIEAARLAREVERPVSLCWTREEEFTWAYCRPAGVIEVAAALDNANKLTAWDFTNINSGGSSIETPYEIPNTVIQFLPSDSPLRSGSYRGLASTANSFAREAFMDEMVVVAGADPLAFRLAQLEEPRLRAVLEEAAKQFRWDERRSGVAKNHGVGLACSIDKGSFVAACAEVEVDPASGDFTVIEICEAYECGAIQNPVNLMSQVEGGIIMGLGGALTEAVEFEDGKITNASLKKYKVPRFQDIPTLNIHLLDRPDLPSEGAGETPIIVVAPAIANALYHATGKPRRALPLQS